eukprot:8522525-Pyramimonas_sp.AAC.1
MANWAIKLTFLQKYQAIAQIARVNGHSWIPFVGEDIATMMSAGEPAADFFHPLCVMESGRYRCWSYSVHIASGSTISFRELSKKKKPSLLPEYHLREQ